MGFLNNDSNNFLASTGPGTIHAFQGSRLEADHPPEGDRSNLVATTGWVSAIMSGAPLWPTVSKWGLDPTLNISVSSGVVSKPGGAEVCNVAATTTTPLAVNANSLEHVWVRYSDCAVVVSTNPVDASLGTLIALVTTNSVTITSIENLASYGGYASVLSPQFQGDPRVPHPPLGDRDNSIPTTKWVHDTLMSYLLGVGPVAGLPRVVDKGGLKVNVTEGVVMNPPTSTEFPVYPMPNDLAINASTTEYVWCRYSDAQIVASTSIPPAHLGQLLATVVTDTTHILSITAPGGAGSSSSWLANNFGIGFGGYIVPYAP